ncbi:MAG: hypothetical protein KF729_33755 [Sandaracinaceae bacterium]|nr:hypothetical protein [Sandaracinaceae bacterium]
MHLPLHTLRDLGLVLVFVADTALDGARRALRRLHPYVAPPPDLQIQSTTGALYTGVLLIDDNDVLAGLVMRVGYEPPPPAAPHRLERPSTFGASPWRSSSPLARRFDDEDEEDDSRLPSWADDPRSEREPWRR